ncbi:MAG: putative membrane protein [Motiliproteus sp.]|jgi:putative membrane protein
MSKETRNKPGTFKTVESVDAKESSAQQGRIPEIFMLKPEETPEGPPESIDTKAGGLEGQDDDQPAVLPGSLERRATRGLKTLVIVVMSYVSILLAYNTYEVIAAALAIHWSLAALVGAVIVTLLLIAGRILWIWHKDQESVSVVYQFQRDAKRFRSQRSHQHIEPYLNALSAFYADKSQSETFAHMRALLPDYADDKEALEHIDNLFVSVLDKQAFACITDYSAQTGVAVALSPWAPLDMVLTLWRNVRMIMEISKVYGIRPSYRNRLRIFVQVMNSMAFAGVSEMATDFLVSSTAQSNLLPQVMARTAQGFGSAIFSVRIGIKTARHCRPIPFTDQAVPRAAQFIKPISGKISSVLSSESALCKQRDEGPV